jgi:hypothetical protein
VRPPDPRKIEANSDAWYYRVMACRTAVAQNMGRITNACNAAKVDRTWM